MLGEDGDETLAMGRLQQMHHLVNDHVFKKIFRLLDQLSVQANIAGAMVTAPPLGLHALQVIPRHLDLQLVLPLADQRRHHGMQLLLVPCMHHLCAFKRVATGAHR